MEEESVIKRGGKRPPAGMIWLCPYCGATSRNWVTDDRGRRWDWDCKADAKLVSEEDLRNLTLPYVREPRL